jgi:hypothetical protein
MIATTLVSKTHPVHQPAQTMRGQCCCWIVREASGKPPPRNRYYG